ncbi:PilZ domain-containing protein [Mesorhizobium sp. B2-3-14]|uniref:PilZ domain-containing protein n=1 Tax=Mesorhizobium sp. B2-3-14 TaxID=2589950 RepID=UPI00112638F3|nr:PilZ domain-containing protein [Mesorhizobium sp. B2-3-14]TPL85485.1 PilZ domain-containing protein [Mesorhizobium sp. B2-3-14]
MTDKPSEPPVERRTHLREVVLKEAFIITQDGEIGCAVRNQHEHGAELRVAAGVEVPNTFRLRVPLDGATYRAEVRWRKGERLGIQIHGNFTLKIT